MTVTPVNYRKQDASPEAIARDVDYALQIADFYLEKLPGGAPALVGRRVLELGPGYSLGTAVILACHGATVTVADRYLSPYDADYHGPFLRALLERLAGERRQLSPEPILALLEAEDFVQPGLSCLHLGIEDLHEVADDAFDLVVSNAVFEHVERVPEAWDVLARITRPGGHGIHQVDFRDHRDFSRPLEYMTLSPEAFSQLFADVHGECGNRWRPCAMQVEIERAGFTALEFDENMSADPAYLADVLARIHPSFAGLDAATLRPISGCFVLRCEAGLAELAPESPADLARARSRYGFAAPLVAGRDVLDLGCGTGAGARLLLAAGAARLTGVERDPSRLEQARRRDPRGAGDSWLELDPAGPLPIPDQSVDVVTAFEVLGRADDPAALVAELGRVLRPDGVAFVARPVEPGQQTAVLETLAELLEPFAWVRFFAQVDVVTSLVLPVDGPEGQVVEGRLSVPAAAAPGDPATTWLVARCHLQRPAEDDDPAPVAQAFGLPESPDEALPAADLGAASGSLLHDDFTARARARWDELGM